MTILIFHPLSPILCQGNNHYGVTDNFGKWAPSSTYGRAQREFSIQGILDESRIHFFSMDHEKWFSKVSISSRTTRITICNLVLVSKYENGHMIISICGPFALIIKYPHYDYCIVATIATNLWWQLPPRKRITYATHGNARFQRIAAHPT